MACGPPLRRLTIHSSAVRLSKFRMLTRWYRIGSSSCSKKTDHRFPNCACLCCGVILLVSEVHLRLCYNLSWFRTCGCFLACTHDKLHLFPIYLRNRRHVSFVPSATDAVRHNELFFTEVSCWTFCPGSPLHIAQANHDLRCVSFRQLCPQCK